MNQFMTKKSTFIFLYLIFIFTMTWTVQAQQTTAPVITPTGTPKATPVPESKPPIPKPMNSSPQQETIKSARIISADASDKSTVIILFDSAFEKFDTNELELVVASGKWDKNFDPGFQPVTIKKATKSKDKLDKTVISFELAETLAEDGKLSKKAQPEDFEDFQVYYKGDLAKDKEQANNLVTWQMDHGGWTKAMEKKYEKPWNGREPRTEQVGMKGEEQGTIDNSATIREIRYLAYVYKQTRNSKYKKAIQKGLDFLLKMQYPSGGWPQIYPARDISGGTIHYTEYVTFNDEAMIRVLELFDQIRNRQSPFDTNVIDAKYYPELTKAADKGLDYILKSQIKIDGKLTVWCAQHDPVTYEPRPARAYEHISLSGSESVGIVRYLLGRPEQTEVMKQAAQGAIAWFIANQIDGYAYIRQDPKEIYFYPNTPAEPKTPLWYRFYEINSGRPIFSGRDSVIKYTIYEIEKERRDGYSWAGPYAQRLLETVKTIGYYPDKLYVRVVANNSKNNDGLTLQIGDIKQIVPRFGLK